MSSRVSRPREPRRELPQLYELLAHSVKLEDIVYPVAFQHHALKINILEVAKIPRPESHDYMVIVQITEGRRSTRPFPIFAKDTLDFVRKLRIELMKYRAMKRILTASELDKILR